MASDLGLHCLSTSQKKDARHEWVKKKVWLCVCVYSPQESLQTQHPYHIDPKFSERQVLGSSVDPDQTAPEIWSGSTVCYSICVFWKHYSMVKPHCSNLRIFAEFFWCPYFLALNDILSHSSQTKGQRTHLVSLSSVWRRDQVWSQMIRQHCDTVYTLVVHPSPTYSQVC